jgi:hypothetical protein
MELSAEHFGSTAEEYVARACRMARFILSVESRGPGDMEGAMRRLARRHKQLDYQVLWNLRYRPPKAVFTHHFDALVQAYRDACMEQAAAVRRALDELPADVAGKLMILKELEKRDDRGPDRATIRPTADDRRSKGSEGSARFDPSGRGGVGSDSASAQEPARIAGSSSGAGEGAGGQADHPNHAEAQACNEARDAGPPA